jgi:hypothetical protein
MDHRCGQRRAVRATVLLRRRGWAGWVVGELADLSVSGAYVELHAGTLPLHAQVRLEAACAGPDGARLMHCTAIVVRAGPGGIGLAFDEVAPAGLAPLFARTRQTAAHEAVAGT